MFNRKNDKKKMIWGFLFSLVAFGMGCGLGFIGTLDFEMLTNNEGMLKKEVREYQMRDDLFFYLHEKIDFVYVETPIEQVKIEYTINQFCNLGDYSMEQGGIHLFTSCENAMKMIREWLREFNEKRIIPMNNDINQIVVYASSENIEKIQNNLRKYHYY